MTPTLHAWAARHGVTSEALADLARIVAPPLAPDAPPAHSDSEAYAQSLVRLEAAQHGVRLFRNNNGALKDDKGRLVRFGLGNDSPAVNERLKSSDLIGWRPVVVTPAHVGATIAQFMAREIKPRGWRFTGGGRETAQAAWIQLVLADGGDACFASGEGTI